MGSIALVGEAYGADEERVKQPFIGSSGRLLNSMLAQAGLRREDCYVTNTFNFRPAGNDIKTLCGKKKEMPADYSLPPISQGQYIRPEYLPELVRLREELAAQQPNLIVALGNTACWALMQRTGIKALRGAVTSGTLLPGIKIVPTWHPAAVMRDISLRPSCVLDLEKAKVESAFPEIRRPERLIWLEPTLADLDLFWEMHLKDAAYISVDIENPHETLSCIGFAPNPHVALVLPFEDPGKPNWHYWATPQEEKAALLWARKVLASSVPKIGQNFWSYDVIHLWGRYGLRVNNAQDDTMLLHHSLQPEESKDLGFLGSLYCNDCAWKLLSTRRNKKKTIKRDQ